MPTEFNTTTGANLVAQNAKNAVEAWEKGARLAEYEFDIMSRFEGGSSEAAIATKTLPKEAGAVINFRTEEGFYEDGVRGDELISDNPGPEALDLDAFNLVIDYVRHAAKTNLRAGLITGLGDELASGMNVKLGKWLARKKNGDIQMLFTRMGNGENYVMAGGKANRDALRQTDTVSWNMVTGFGQALKTLGAQPARVVTDTANNRPIHGYTFLGLGESWLNLKNSTQYLNAVQNARERDESNPLFKGGLVHIDGHTLISWDPPDHAGKGSVGSALNGRAKLGAAIAPGTTAIDILGGGKAAFSTNTKSKYFEFFSNAPYRFGTAAGQSIAADTTTDRYVIIYNVSGVNAGKWGFYKFRTNNGHKLTMHSATSRLAAAASGVAATTVGSVVWNAAVNTETHPEGSLIIETNASGIPFSRTIILGAMAACRGYSSLERIVRSQEITEGGFLKSTWIRSILGQSLYKRMDGRYPNFLVIESALNYAGLVNMPNPA